MRSLTRIAALAVSFAMVMGSVPAGAQVYPPPINTPPPGYAPPPRPEPAPVGPNYQSAPHRQYPRNHHRRYYRHS